MISFKLSEEQVLIRDSLQGFAKDVLARQARAIDEAGEIPGDVLQAGHELGLVSAAIPEAHGGAGGDRSPVTNAVVLEALGYGCASQGAAIMAPSLFVHPLLDFGTEEQKKELLPLFTGRDYHAATAALHETQFAFGAGAMKTTAEKRGNGYVLNGVKRLVPMATTASHVLVLAAEGGAGVDNVQAFIVPRDAKGLSIERESGQMGLKPVAHGKVTLDKVELPGAARLGGDQGVDARRLLASVRVAGAAMAVGLSRAVADTAIPYARERVAFGEAIGKKQAIAFMLADMHIECETMRLMLWKAASQIEQGLDASKATALAQDYIRRRSMKIADDGVQVFGGHGFIRDLPLEMWLRNARALTVLEGPAAV
jgi:acyl-CoA dehydrogenase